MKGIKKLSVIALGLACALSLASCVDKPAKVAETPINDRNDMDILDEDREYIDFQEMEAEIGDPSTLVQPTNYPTIYVNEQNKLLFKLVEIQVRTTDARTNFYLGEEFTSKGILVLARFNKLDENGNELTENGKVVSFLASVHTFFVDSSNVDTSIMGVYDVNVSYRYGEDVKTTTYTVRVDSSEFETTPNLKYVAGIKANYAADPSKKLSPDGRVITRYCTPKGDNSFTLTPEELQLQIVKNEVNGVASAFKQTLTDFSTSGLTNDTTTKTIKDANNLVSIDYSKVNTGKVGSYPIKITYNEGDITINGEKRSNVVQAFIIVDVIAPIVSMELEDESFDVDASVDIIDLSKYNLIITRQYEGRVKVEAVPITTEKFVIKDVTGYIQGNQEATIESREACEDGTFASVKVIVKVKASSTYNISVVTEIDNGTGKTEVVSGKTWCYDYKINDVLTLNKADITNIADKSRTCNEDGLAGFKGFAKIDKFGGDSYAEFNITEDDTTLIIYVGSNGDDERAFAVYNEEGEAIFEEMATLKQTPRRYVLNLSKGKYRLSAIGTTITFHGYVIATKK